MGAGDLGSSCISTCGEKVVYLRVVICFINIRRSYIRGHGWLWMLELIHPGTDQLASSISMVRLQQSLVYWAYR